MIALLASSFVGDYGEFTISSNDNIAYNYNRPYIASGDPSLQDLNNGASGFVVNQNTRDIINKILESLPKERSFAVRQPATKKQLVNTMQPLSNLQGFDQTNQARLGHQIDSLVGNEYEGATFIYSFNDNPVGRQREENYYSEDSKYVPFIAEAEYFDNGVTGQCANALPLIKNRHISSINETYNLNTLNIWKNQNCYNEIAKKTGYRFVLNSSRLQSEATQNTNFNLSLNLTNAGYASPFNQRQFEVILRNKSTGQNYATDVTNQADPRKWFSSDIAYQINLNIVANVPIGDYDVFLNLPDPMTTIKNNPDYSVQFSNQNMWEASSGYNKLNQSIIIKPTTETTINFKVLLSGAYDSRMNKMTNSLRSKNLIPNLQPFASSFDYFGVEKLPLSNLETDICDWVLVELRHPDSNLLIAQKAAILKSDGSIVEAGNSTTGNTQSGLTFSNLNGQYKIIIRHRNHLAIATNIPIDFSLQSIQNLDFTTNINVRAGNQNQISGLYGLRQANVSSDNSIDATDRNIIFTSSEFSDLYINQDVNLDGVVDALDRTIALNSPEASDNI